MTERKTAVPTAQCWYNSAHNSVNNWPDRVICMENAYNHTENALFAARKEIENLTNLLVEHHQHHMTQGDIIYEDDKGGYGTFDGAEAYSESDLGERTYEAIPYPSDGNKSDADDDDYDDEDYEGDDY